MATSTTRRPVRSAGATSSSRRPSRRRARPASSSSRRRRTTTVPPVAARTSTTVLSNPPGRQPSRSSRRLCGVGAAGVAVPPVLVGSSRTASVEGSPTSRSCCSDSWSATLGVHVPLSSRTAATSSTVMPSKGMRVCSATRAARSSRSRRASEARTRPRPSSSTSLARGTDVVQPVVDDSRATRRTWAAGPLYSAETSTRSPRARNSGSGACARGVSYTSLGATSAL